MRIVETSLCLRFYTSDGWTREAVRELLSDDKRLARVMPRYFDDRDKIGWAGFVLDDGATHSECEYFAVYGVCQPFSCSALAEHELIPF